MSYESDLFNCLIFFFLGKSLLRERSLFKRGEFFSARRGERRDDEEGERFM